MNRNLSRVIAASVGALALAGMGASVASATDSVTPDGYYAGTIFLADQNDGSAVAQPLAYDYGVIALPAAGDLASTFAIPAGATEAWTFIAPQGQENDITKWNAKAVVGLTPGGILYPDVTPQNLITQGLGSPAGTNAVKAAGGAYSLGLAFTTNSGVTLINEFYGHVQITPVSGQYTFTDTAPAKIPTTTTLTAPASGTAGTPVNVTATVAPAAATGSVEFLEGATVLSTDTTAPYAASLNLAAGSHTITARYVGDAAYAASTSTASTILVAGAAVATSFSSLTATSATGEAGKPVVITATMAPVGAQGTVAFTATSGSTVQALASSVTNASGVASLTTNSLGAGAWTITATFTGSTGYLNSTSTQVVTVTLAAASGASNAATPDPQTVLVEIPKGAISISTPWTPTHPLQMGTLVFNAATSTYELAAPVSLTDFLLGGDHSITVTNQRPDNPSWSAFVASSPFTNTTGAGTFTADKASLVNLSTVQAPGNLLQSTDVHVTPVAALSSTPATFAEYTGASLGTAWINGSIDLKGIESSNPSGIYTAIVTFTAY